MRAFHIFLFALLISLIVHGMYWRYLDDSVDQQNWIREMTIFHEMPLASHRGGFGYGYPATTLLLASSFVWDVFGILPRQAFAGIMSVGISLPVALSVLLCRILRPNNLWWAGTLGIMTLGHSYYSATPPSAIVTAYCTLLLLFGLYIYEKRIQDIRTSIAFGVVAGVSMATRLDISVVVFLFLCVFLFPRMKWRAAATALCTAGVIFFILNPYMHAFPVVHIQDIIHKVTSHAEFKVSLRSPYRPIVHTVPLGIFGLLMSAALLLFPKSTFRPVPRAYLVMLILLSAGVGGALLGFSAYHPAWYFYPVLQIFEVLFALYLIDALDAIHRSRVIWAMLGLLILGNAHQFFLKMFL